MSHEKNSWYKVLTVLCLWRCVWAKDPHRLCCIYNLHRRTSLHKLGQMRKQIWLSFSRRTAVWLAVIPRPTCSNRVSTGLQECPQWSFLPQKCTSTWHLSFICLVLTQHLTGAFFFCFVLQEEIIPIFSTVRCLYIWWPAPNEQASKI